MAQRPTARMGPLIRAQHPWQEGALDSQPLAAADPDLASIASVVRFRRGEFLCRKGEPAQALFSLISGSASSWVRTPDGSEQVIRFLFANDLGGHALAGSYHNSLRAMEAVTAFRLPTEALERRLRRNSELEFIVICRLAEDLLMAQEHAVMISRPRAVARLALFLQQLETRISALESSSPEMFLPMSRIEIASYLNISPEAVSRSFADMLRSGMIIMRDRRFVSIRDRAALFQLIRDGDPSPGTSPDVPGEGSFHE